MKYYQTILREGLPALKTVKRDQKTCPPIDSVASAVALVQGQLKLWEYAEEHAYLIGLDTKGHVLGIFPFSQGTVNAALVNPREILIRLLLIGAVRFLLAHNHPSGDPGPSEEDRQITKRIQEVGTLVGIPLDDHLIVTKDACFSFRQHGLL